MKDNFKTNKYYNRLMGGAALFMFMLEYVGQRMSKGEFDVTSLLAEKTVVLFFYGLFVFYVLSVIFKKYMVGRSLLTVTHFYLFTRKYEIIKIRNIEIVDHYYPYVDIYFQDGRRLSTDALEDITGFVESLKIVLKDNGIDFAMTKVNRKFLR